jgi:hypothetical protein
VSRARRKHGSGGGLSYEFPMLAFLSIMLGVMSIMALATMGLTAEKRAEARQKVTAVQLVGVPPRFRPFHMRCSADKIAWLDDREAWQEIDLISLLGISQPGGGPGMVTREVVELLRFAKAKQLANRALSFSGQQNTLILWIEPEGVHSSLLVQHMFDMFNLSLRIGRLPINPGEEIRLHETRQ